MTRCGCSAGRWGRWDRARARIGARIGSWWWTLRGQRRLRRGDARGAIRAFEAAHRRRGGAFAPVMRLALAHLHAREVPEARRYLADAREEHPLRYEREAAALLGRGGFDLESIHRIGSVTRRLDPLVGSPPLVGSAVALPSRAPTQASLPFGDCRDLDEYARFSAMPAITRAEAAGVDWNRLLGELLEE